MSGKGNQLITRRREKKGNHLVTGGGVEGKGNQQITEEEKRRVIICLQGGPQGRVIR